jgi:hypothetical protein
MNGYGSKDWRAIVALIAVIRAFLPVIPLTGLVYTRFFLALVGNDYTNAGAEHSGYESKVGMDQIPRIAQ